MLSITGMNKFYYIKNFTDMRCKYSMRPLFRIAI